MRPINFDHLGTKSLETMHNLFLYSVVFSLGLISFITCFVAEFKRTKVRRKTNFSIFVCFLIEKIEPSFLKYPCMCVERRYSMGHREELLCTSKSCVWAWISRCSLLLSCSNHWKHSCAPKSQDKN